MPIYKSNNCFGDLFIRFNIVIPKTIDPSKLIKLKEIFDLSVESESNLNVSGNSGITKMLENVSDTDLENLTESTDDSDSSSDSDSDSGSESDSGSDSCSDIDAIAKEVEEIQSSDSE